MSTKDDALKLALEALESLFNGKADEHRAKRCSDAITAIREALAEQPAQQPHCDDCGGFDPECPLAQPAQQQEPVAWTSRDYLTGDVKVLWGRQPSLGPLYTSPPASKPWVGLTDEERREIGHPYFSSVNMSDVAYARAIEAKLKEKNA